MGREPLGAPFMATKAYQIRRTVVLAVSNPGGEYSRGVAKEYEAKTR